MRSLIVSKFTSVVVPDSFSNCLAASTYPYTRIKKKERKKERERERERERAVSTHTSPNKALSLSIFVLFAYLGYKVVHDDDVHLLLQNGQVIVLHGLVPRERILVLLLSALPSSHPD